MLVEALNGWTASRDEVARRCAALVGGTARTAPGDGVSQLARSMVVGGKGLRAQLCVLAYLGCAPGRGLVPDDVLDVSAALELFHTFALVHDDIIDQSLMRRGRPTVHAVMQDEHERADWFGDATEFGRAMAILTGDHLLSQAWAAVAGVGVLHPLVVTLFSQMCQDVVSGETSEIQAAACADVSVATALRVIDRKTGLYTFTYPLLLGCALARVSPDGALGQQVRQIGLQAGRAFQIQDDLLDVYGDEATGKSVGLDAETGRPTLFRARCVAELASSGLTVEAALAEFGASAAAAAGIGIRTGVRDELATQASACLSAVADQVEALPMRSAAVQQLSALITGLRTRRS